MGYKETLLDTLKNMRKGAKMTRDCLESVQTDVKEIPKIRKHVDEHILKTALVNSVQLMNSLDLMIHDLERDTDD